MGLTSLSSRPRHYGAVGAGLASALTDEIHQIELTVIGRIIDKQWRDIPNQFKNVDIDEFVIMPNHIHGILILHALFDRADARPALPFYEQSFRCHRRGGGHAAIEAALYRPAPASTSDGDMDKTKIGQMSCNPAIGGTAKGQVVREIDALGGEMARATDRAGIQFKMLNRGKGPAVWSPRAQCDRALYRRVMTETILSQPGLTVLEDEVISIRATGGKLRPS